MNDLDTYCNLVNLIDKIAIANREATAEELQAIEKLAAKDKIEAIDFADANDCGYQDNWTDIIKAFTELIKSGERVAI